MTLYATMIMRLTSHGPVQDIAGAQLLCLSGTLHMVSGSIDSDGAQASITTHQNRQIDIIEGPLQVSPRQLQWWSPKVTVRNKTKRLLVI